MARARAGGRGARAARSPHALDGARPRSPDRRRDRASACSRRAGGCASSASSRRSSAAAAGTPTSRSPRPAPSSVTWTALRAPGVPRTSLPEKRGPRSAVPARVRLPSERLLAAIPTTHSLGDLGRALLRPRSLPAVVHVYFHDTDLADRRRRVALRALLVLLARVAEPTDLVRLAAVTGSCSRSPVVGGSPDDLVTDCY